MTAHIGNMNMAINVCKPGNEVDVQKMIHLSWETIHTAVDSLVYQLKPFKPILVVGISRGGLIPAIMISHALNLPMETVVAQSYEGTRRTLQKPTEIVGWQKDFNNPRVIVVDDILDSGQTFNAIRVHSEHCKFAALVSKQIYTYPVAHFCNVPKDVWVKFPWEIGNV